MFGFGQFTFRVLESAALYIAPTLSILSHATSPDPVFDITVDGQFEAGHSIELQRDTSGAFSEPTTSSILIESSRRNAGAASHGLGPAANGTWYYRARHINNPYFSDWSATVSHTIATVSDPVGISYVQGFTATKASLLAKGLYRDRIQMPREAAAQNCYFVFAISGLVGIGVDTLGYQWARVDMNNGAGSVDATILAQSVYGNRHHVILFAAPVTSGNVANIELYAGSQIYDYQIAGGFVYNMAQPVGVTTEVIGPTSVANPVTTASVTIPSGGMAIAAFGVDQTGTNTWNNGFTQQASAQVTNTLEIATLSTPGAVTPSVTRTGTRTSCMAVAVLAGAA